ncbi:pre-mRNA-splicing factor cwc22 [Acarospora aff. strigata]|nr:pre-mRNA-splicing factor cwc22 [Acarospora aff. strigata]
MEDPVFLQSAVRLPTPPPAEEYQAYASSKRKRSPQSRSPSPRRRRSPPRGPARAGPILSDVDPQRALERERQLAERLRQREAAEAAPKVLTEEEKQAAAKAEYEKLLNMRSGGTYIPPARLRALQAQITDKTSKEYQRMAWEALKKSINGLINKINVSNIKYIVPELFGENLIRGRGLFCRSLMKAQAASLPFTPIYAAMAAIVNTKLPQVGELLLNRLIVQFRKAFKRNDKAVCLSSTTFIAHLCNQQVAHEMVAAQILLLLLHKPTDDSVEIAVGLTREVGQHLEEMSGPIALAVFDQFRSILHEADIDKRVQYMIEVLFQVRKDRYKDNPAIKEELDLVEEEDQITHRTGLEDEIEVQDGLNVFKFDPEWEEHEEAYKKLKAQILGEADGSDEDDEDESDDSSDDEEAKEEKNIEIKDQSNTDLVNLRRTIYLTIMSSIDFEECCHKLMKVTLPPGQEPELPSMIIECCSQERTYSKFYGLIGERFAKLNRLWTDLFEQSFAKYYDTIHRYETNRLRNIARFFGHMLSSDGIGWHVLSVVRLNEEETTSSSRIFIKILFQDLAEALGMPKLQARLKDEFLRPSFDGLFPTDNPRNTRFSINYFTSIGMGAVTEEMREHLKNMPKPVELCLKLLVLYGLVEIVLPITITFADQRTGPWEKLLTIDHPRLIRVVGAIHLLSHHGGNSDPYLGDHPDGPLHEAVIGRTHEVLIVDKYQGDDHRLSLLDPLSLLAKVVGIPEDEGVATLALSHLHAEEIDRARTRRDRPLRSISTITEQTDHPHRRHQDAQHETAGTAFLPLHQHGDHAKDVGEIVPPPFRLALALAHLQRANIQPQTAIKPEAKAHSDGAHNLRFEEPGERVLATKLQAMQGEIWIWVGESTKLRRRGEAGGPGPRIICRF